jgi:hypothetical protein
MRRIEIAFAYWIHPIRFRAMTVMATAIARLTTSDEGTLDCIGKIIEDGNKMNIDDVVKQRGMFTRK